MLGELLVKVVIAESTLKSHPTALETVGVFPLLMGREQARCGGCPRLEGVLVGIQSRFGAVTGDGEPIEATCRV